MFYKTINLVKINYNLKKNQITTKLNKKDINIIKLFIKFNIIKFVKKNRNNYTIYFNYLKKEPVFKNIINLHKPSKLLFLSLKQINKINKKKNSIFILSTTKGLITNFEAEKLKIGGVLLFLLQI